MTRLALALVLAATLGPAVAARTTAPPDARDRGPRSLDVTGYPAEQQENYALFADKCSKCHTLARPINSRFNAQEWKAYLKRMLRRPDCNTSEEQARQIYSFLKYRCELSPAPVSGGDRLPPPLRRPVPGAATASPASPRAQAR